MAHSSVEVFWRCTIYNVMYFLNSIPGSQFWDSETSRKSGNLPIFLSFGIQRFKTILLMSPISLDMPVRTCSKQSGQLRYKTQWAGMIRRRLTPTVMLIGVHFSNEMIKSLKMRSGMGRVTIPGAGRRSKFNSKSTHVLDHLRLLLQFVR